MISQSYILTGLSTDTKPVPSTDGSLFIENDTAFMYTSLAGAWVLKTTGSNLSLTDTTNNDANTTRHGFFPKLPLPTGKLLKDNLGWGNTTMYNQSVTSQVGFAVDTYLAGSAVTIPAGSLKVGSRYHCVFNVVKTAAGIATPIINVRFGINGSIVDASRGVLTFSVQTGIIDEGKFEFWATVRTVGAGTSAVIQSLGELQHRLSITGLGIGVAEPEIATSVGFDSTVNNSIIGISVNGGASAVWTVNVVQAELVNIN